ncbi:MAG: toll/interleukin-1 receptor domain-containing protein [Acidobacteriota bacterium]
MPEQKPEQIRVFVIGGSTGRGAHGSSLVREAGKELGRQLGRDSSIVLVACRAKHDSIDAWTVQGFAETARGPERLVAHYPVDQRTNIAADDRKISEQWRALIQETGLVDPRLRQNSEAVVSSPEDFPDAFLLCQIRALIEDCDVVVAVGGKPASSAAKLLAIASRGYPIVPFAFPEGSASQQEFQKQRSWLGQRFKDLNQPRLLDSLEDPGGVERVLELIHVTRRAHGQHSIFISYPWKKRAEADYVEAFLRRHPRLEIFRDEESIAIGESITDEIKTNLQSCDVFVALWCAEYAASPNCYDEFHIALARDDCKVVVIRIDSTRPVWPELRVQDSLHWKGKWPQVEDYRTVREAIAFNLDQLLKELPPPKEY